MTSSAAEGVREPKEDLVNPLDLSGLIGEWFGVGTISIGNMQGTIQEYVRLETTDRIECLSYIRHSRIVIGGQSALHIGGQSALHNEAGYIRATDISLLLSRGSYVILPWDASLGGYRQAEGSPDTRNMTRKVSIAADGIMTWDSAMEVQQGGVWVTHTILTTFDSLSLVVSTAHSPNKALQLTRPA